MDIYYKKDICEELHKAGYSSYSLQEKGILNSASWTRLKKQQLVSWDALDTICTLLQVQPGDLVGYKYQNKK